MLNGVKDYLDRMKPERGWATADTRKLAMETAYVAGVMRAKGMNAEADVALALADRVLKLDGYRDPA